MTWEETIQFIRTQPEYKELVKLAYFEEDLPLNVERFKSSEEYYATKTIISQYVTLNSSVKLLDIGSGNGISSAAFALDGVQVVSVEPDPSQTIGAGAIQKLKEHYQLSNLSVHQAFAEELNFPDNNFDIVYARQCMHHAFNLKQFLKECARVLKKGGLLITVRDHVVFNEADKKWFLENHPLQKFYGGENAFSASEYKNAMVEAGLEIKEEMKHFDSVINYFPLCKTEKENAEAKSKEFAESVVKKKLGAIGKINLFRNLALKHVKNKLGKVHDENKVPGRMYTFLAIKK